MPEMNVERRLATRLRLSPVGITSTLGFLFCLLLLAVFLCLALWICHLELRPYSLARTYPKGSANSWNCSSKEGICFVAELTRSRGVGADFKGIRQRLTRNSIR